MTIFVEIVGKARNHQVFLIVCSFACSLYCVCVCVCSRSLTLTLSLSLSGLFVVCEVCVLFWCSSVCMSMLNRRLCLCVCVRMSECV